MGLAAENPLFAQIGALIMQGMAGTPMRQAETLDTLTDVVALSLIVWSERDDQTMQEHLQLALEALELMTEETGQQIRSNILEHPDRHKAEPET